MATTYSNPYTLGNTGVPPDTLGHNATWPEGLARDNNNFIYEVRGWDEAHYDINKRDPANGNILWTSQQVVSGSDMHGVAVEPDGSWAYTTNAGGDRSKGQGYAYIYRINLAPNIPREQRRTNFTTAGDHIAVISAAARSGDGDQEPLHSIAVAGPSIWVTDSKGGRVIKYDKVTGVQQQVITALLARGSRWRATVTSGWPRFE
jgi:DNA-binding beta-propeller fold protein YncE